MRVFRSAAIAEEGLVDFWTVDREGTVLRTVGAEATALFVDVFVAGRLVVIPDAAVAVIFSVEGEVRHLGFILYRCEDQGSVCILILPLRYTSSAHRGSTS
jgi:hypothetical protein